jgi:CoA-transferase family III
LPPYHWRSLCAALGRPALAHHEQFATMGARQKKCEQIDKIISEWTRGLTAHAAEAILQNWVYRRLQFRIAITFAMIRNLPLVLIYVKSSIRLAAKW